MNKSASIKENINDERINKLNFWLRSMSDFENADIEQAFIWWELTGSDSTGHIVIQNPDMQQDTLVGEVIGGMASPYGCWGVGYRVFRADATHLITGKN